MGAHHTSTLRVRFAPSTAPSFAEDCVGDEEVVLFLEGDLTEDRERVVKAHLDLCDECRAAVANGASRVTGGEPRNQRPAATPVEVGSLFAGKYTVDRILGRGGMGLVVAARHAVLGTRVAIKTMHDELLDDEDAARRFAREAMAAARLTGEHAARVLDVGRLESGAPYIVMEYLEGMDLGRVLDALGPLPIGEAVGYILDACEAIAEAHAHGIVHRDLKPANIFLAWTGNGARTVKVVDFGLAKTFDGALAAGESGLTRAHAMIGSPHYMSPEQIESARDVDPRTDVWALGACLHELIAGQPPFRAANLQLLCARILLEPPVSLEIERPGTPRPIAAVVRRCLLRDRSARFQSVLELIAALRAALGDAEADSEAATLVNPTLVPTPFAFAATSPSLPMPPSLRRPMRRARAVVLGVAGALAAAAILAGAASAHRGQALAGTVIAEQPTPTIAPDPPFAFAEPEPPPTSAAVTIPSPSSRPASKPLRASGSTSNSTPISTPRARAASPAATTVPTTPSPAVADPPSPPPPTPPASTPSAPSGLASDRHG